ncbi:MAG: DUF4238 domain-containing protein [Solirubrobacteraceae bacterium]
MPTTKARRHHFVPSFALSKFATPQRRDGVVFQLDTRSGQPKKTSPDEACFVEELYTQDDEGKADRVLEAFLSIVENYAAQALDRLISDPRNLPREDRQSIAYHLALQYQRTPVALEHSMASQQAMMLLTMGIQFADAENFKKKHRKIFDDGASDEEIEALRQKTLNHLKGGGVTIDDPKLGAFQMMLRTADAVASAIASLSWGVVAAKEDEFVICDRALAVHDSTPKFPWSGHALLSSPTAETIFPLTPGVCLALFQRERAVVSYEIGADEVRELNLRTYGWASQYIYGRTQDVVQRVRKQAKEKPELVIRPRTSKPVLLEWADPDDPTVGAEHVKKGWPRGVMIPDENGAPRFAAYTLIDPADEASVSAAITAEEMTERVRAAAREKKGLREVRHVDPDDVEPS